MNTFEQFQKSRRLCTSKKPLPHEGDLQEDGEPRFVYEVPITAEWAADDPFFRYSISICKGGFDIGYDGYPATDFCVSLEEAERRLWNWALSEQWGLDGEKVPIRRTVRCDQLLKEPDREFADLEEALDEIKWTSLLQHLHDWCITARWCGHGFVELVGDSDQINNFLAENRP